MKFTVIEAPQRSPEWFAARLGRLTGSRADDVISEPTKAGKERVGRRNLRVQLALERLVGHTMESDYQSWEMRQGIEREPEAREFYEAITGSIVEQTGFLRSEEYLVGCSLDGHVDGMEGIIELKCPTPAIHLEALRYNRVPQEYMGQVWHNLWVSGAKWCDWMSYNPDFPEGAQAKRVRVKRVKSDIDRYSLAALLFLTEVEKEYKDIAQLTGAAA
jgi:predicted phage-related endonuclease